MSSGTNSLSNTNAITINTGNGFYTVPAFAGDSSGIAWSYNTDTPSGAALGIKRDAKSIGPRLYFRYVKSKLKKTERNEARKRLGKLKMLLASVSETEQAALYEELAKNLVNVARQIETDVAGFGTYVLRSEVEKFRPIVSENPSDFKAGHTALAVLDKLADFPRIIPPAALKAMNRAKELGLFDSFEVLHLNYTKDQPKTAARKIREKDPILFGVHSSDPDKLYFIADWIDEHCDLTFSDMVEKIQEVDVGFDPSKVEAIDERFIEKLKAEVKAREERVRNTRPSNFRALGAEEVAAEKSKPTGSFWSRLRSLFRS